MKSSALFLLLVGLVLAAGETDYQIPGLESEEILMSIHVWGEVRNPGTYLVPLDADLIVGLSAAGGPTGNANLKKIRLLQGDLPEEIEYDLDAFLNGNSNYVPGLSPGATIFVIKSHADWWRDTLDITYTFLLMANLIWLMSER